MPIINIIRDIARGLARGFDLFLTGRHGYLEKVTTPRIETRRPL